MVGRIPARAARAQPPSCTRSDCCTTSGSTCSQPEPTSIEAPETTADASVAVEDQTALSERLAVGGLEIPNDVDFSEYTLLFIGSDTSRQFLNIVLRFLSGSTPRAFWTWRPNSASLSTELSPAFQRKLNRRFYLVQKAKTCAVFGILVANLSDSYMKSVVTSLRQMLQQQGRASYTFVVGKINPAKLANFAEVDCFILVACPEHSLLEDDREFPTPVITPLEACIGMGLLDWGSVSYSLDTKDYLALASSTQQGEGDGGESDGSAESDAPYFSLVTGRYESAPTKEKETTDLTALPGQGKLAVYQSAAADFLRQREYQGLEVQAGETEVRAAVQGQEGIASDYGNR